MILTKENIQEWKTLLNKEMAEWYNLPSYSDTLSDKEWIESYEGESVDEAVINEASGFNAAC